MKRVPRRLVPHVEMARATRPAPVPIIPIVGDFTNLHSHAYRGFEHIRSEIIKGNCHCGTSALLDSAKRPYDLLKLLTSEHGTQLRTDSCHPLPLPIHEGSSRHHTSQGNLPPLLAAHDVISVIAAGQTESTLSLLDILHPYNTPVCVTVASINSLAINASGGSHQSILYTNLLRLNPTNDQQAQALLARVRSLLDAGKPRSIDIGQETKQRDFTLVAGDHGNDYCRDLARAIRRQAELTQPSLSYNDIPGNTFERVPEEGIVVYVGYAAQLRHFPAHRVKWRGILTSDGFPEEAIANHIKRKRGDRTRFFVCQSSIPPVMLIWQAFEAMSTCWRRAWQAADTHGRPEGLPPLMEFSERVRNQLQEGADDGSHYHFLGNQNMRSTYFVRRLV